MRWLLSLYPRAWRRRYQAEMEAVLDEMPFSLRAMLDLLLGAADAHLGSHAPQPRRRSITALRFALLVALGAVAVFLMAAAVGRAPLGPVAGPLAVCACWAALALLARLARARLLGWYGGLLAARLAVSALTGLAGPRLLSLAVAADIAIGAGIALWSVRRARMDWPAALVLVAALTLVGPNPLEPGYAWSVLQPAGGSWSRWPEAYLEGLRYAFWAAALAAFAASARRRPGPGWAPDGGAGVAGRPPGDPDAPVLAAAAGRERIAARVAARSRRSEL